MNHTITDEQLKKVREALVSARSYVSYDSVGRIIQFDCREALSILDAIEKQPESAWMPIETAPRDGRMVYLNRQKQRRGTSRKYSTVMGKWGGHCWRTINCHYASDDQFTHWMPLPSPPQPTPAQEAEAELLEGMHGK